MQSRFTPEQIARIHETALRAKAQSHEAATREAEAKQKELHAKYSEKYQAMLNYWQPLVSADLLLLVVPFEEYAANYRGEYEKPHYFHVEYGSLTYHIEHHRNANSTEFFQIYRSGGGYKQELFTAEAVELEIWAGIGHNVASEMVFEAMKKKEEVQPGPTEPDLDAQIGGTLTVIEDYIEDSYSNYDKIRSMQEGYGRLHYLLNTIYLPERHVLTREAMDTFIAIAVAACRTIIDLGAAGGNVEAD